MKQISLIIIGLVFCLSCGDNKETKKDKEVVENTCDTDKVSFKDDIWPIIQTNCLECHNEADYKEKADGNKMFNYKHIKKLADRGLIYGNVQHLQGYKAMPYERDKLDSCSIAKIKAWIAMDAPEN